MAEAGAAEAGHEGGAGDWKHWKAKNEVSNLASLQRGARKAKRGGILSDLPPLRSACVTVTLA